MTLSSDARADGSQPDQSPSNDTSTAADPRTVDRRFFGALVGRDRATLDAVLTDDFLMVDIVAGGVVSRAELLELTGSGEVSFAAIEQFPDETVVREYGGTAVAIGRTVIHATLPGGDTVVVPSRYTHVLVRGTSGGGWLLASAQGTRIATG
jgi:ketosteroid isomerase-like protein